LIIGTLCQKKIVVCTSGIVFTLALALRSIAVGLSSYGENFNCWALVRKSTNVVVIGTTLFECKTGYGLTAEAELKMLRVIDKSRDHIVPDVSVTYCAAHAVPE